MTLTILNIRGATILQRGGMDGKFIPWAQIDSENHIPQLMRDQIGILMQNAHFMKTIGVTFHNGWQVLIENY